MPRGARAGRLMQEPDLPPVPSPDRDDLLLERLREIAGERDGVPDEVLAAARALFTRVGAKRAGSEVTQ
jgi:hypothetical protein